MVTSRTDIGFFTAGNPGNRIVYAAPLYGARHRGQPLHVQRLPFLSWRLSPPSLSGWHQLLLYNLIAFQLRCLRRFG